MNNIVRTLLTLLPLFCFSQPVTVSTSSHTVPQLVNNVLINSPCVSATNVTWRTGSNFGSSNGIGYFENTNPDFPMARGVVLSTGSALNIPGPNNTLLSDGTLNWIGDTNLAAAMATAGINLTSVNATVLEFDFTPISPSFGFDFLFASEEYGDLQCQASDAFAFLLTNMDTGVTMNLAVVPGTDLPISVPVIRDILYNPSCVSANAQYFGNYFGGPEAAASPINFNGTTKKLTALAALIANTPYHLKIVVADRENNTSDSAIFIAADSMNIGQNVLGQDLTVANDTARCTGDTYVIDTHLSSTAYTFSWKKDGVLLSDTTASLTISDGGNYEVIYQHLLSACPPVSDMILIEYEDCGLHTTSFEKQNITVFPNPVTETLNLDYELQHYGLVKIEISNALGQIVYTSEYQQNEGKHRLSIALENQKKGVYILKLSEGKNNFQTKILRL